MSFMLAHCHARCKRLQPVLLLCNMAVLHPPRSPPVSDPCHASVVKKINKVPQNEGKTTLYRPIQQRRNELHSIPENLHLPSDQVGENGWTFASPAYFFFGPTMIAAINSGSDAVTEACVAEVIGIEDFAWLMVGA